MTPARQPVHPKVQATGAVGAFVVLTVFIAEQFGLDVPGDVAAALTIVAGVAAGYLKGVTQ